MSGGSWDYFYLKLEDVASQLKQSDCPYRRALGTRLLQASIAMHVIEWVDSNDRSPPDDVEAIKKALGNEAAPLAWEEMRGQAIEMIKKLEEFTDTEVERL